MIPKCCIREGRKQPRTCVPVLMGIVDPVLGQSDWICETRVGCSSRSMKVCPGHTNDRHGRGDPPDGSDGTLGPSTRPGARGGFIIHRSITVELSTAQTPTAKIAGMSDLQRKHLSRACSFVLVLGPLFSPLKVN